MFQFSFAHIHIAIQEMLKTGHPAIICILALARDIKNGHSRSLTASQTDVLDDLFRVDGSNTLEWYVPLGPPRGAKAKSGRWRGSAANYVGRSLQRMSKDLRKSGAYEYNDGVPYFNHTTVHIFDLYLRGRKPSIMPPIPVWPYAVWRYRREAIVDLNDAVEKFWKEFGLSRLDTLFTNQVPETVEILHLETELLSDENLIEFLEPRPQNKEGLYHTTIWKMPLELRTAFKQYLVYFNDYMLVTRGLDIGLEIHSAKDGLELRIRKPTEVGFDLVDNYIDEYASYVTHRLDNITVPFVTPSDQITRQIAIVELRSQVRNLHQAVETRNVKIGFLERMVSDKDKYLTSFSEKRHTYNIIAQASSTQSEKGNFRPGKVECAAFLPLRIAK